jgi:hypothetical protein
MQTGIREFVLTARQNLQKLTASQGDGEREETA